GIAPEPPPSAQPRWRSSDRYREEVVGPSRQPLGFLVGPLGPGDRAAAGLREALGAGGELGVAAQVRVVVAVETVGGARVRAAGDDAVGVDDVAGQHGAALRRQLLAGALALDDAAPRRFGQLDVEEVAAEEAAVA